MILARGSCRMHSLSMMPQFRAISGDSYLQTIAPCDSVCHHTVAENEGETSEKKKRRVSRRILAWLGGKIGAEECRVMYNKSE